MAVPRADVAEQYVPKAVKQGPAEEIGRQAQIYGEGNTVLARRENQDYRGLGHSSEKGGGGESIQ